MHSDLSETAAFEWLWFTRIASLQGRCYPTHPATMAAPPRATPATSSCNCQLACPVCDPGQHTSGTAETFQAASVGFREAVGQAFGDPNRGALRAVIQTASPFCGVEITTSSVPQHIQIAHRGIGDSLDRGSG